MIYKLKRKTDVALITGKFPYEVISEAERIADILDIYYNSQDVDGGYILIAEDIADLVCIKEYYFDYENTLYEFKDVLSKDWISILYLIGTEYSVTLITRSNSID